MSEKVRRYIASLSPEDQAILESVPESEKPGLWKWLEDEVINDDSPTVITVGQKHWIN